MLSMPARAVRGAGLALAAALALAGCAQDPSEPEAAVEAGASQGASKTSPAAVPTAAPATTTPLLARERGVPVVDASFDLGATPRGVPDGWTTHEFHGLTFAMPAGSDLFREEPQDSNGAFTSFWSGPTIRSTPIGTPSPGWEVGMDFIMVANPTVQWDGLIRDGQENTYTATVPGATFVGGSTRESEVAEPRLNETRPVSEIQLYVQGASGTYYEMSVTAYPGEAGLEFLRQFVGSMSVQ